MRVRRRLGGWRVRLADTGGALAAAEIRRPGPFLPRVGARIALKGNIRYDEAHEWYIVDPVDEWVEVPD